MNIASIANPYPVSVTVQPDLPPRNRLTTAAWCAIPATGRYPAGLFAFSVGVLRWEIRIEAYLLPLVDEFPPFTLK